MHSSKKYGQRINLATILMSAIVISSMLFSAVTPVLAQSDTPGSTPTVEPTLPGETATVEPLPTETLAPPTDIPTELPTESPVVTETPVVTATYEVTPTVDPTITEIPTEVVTDEAPIQAFSSAPANDHFEDADEITLSVFSDTIDTTGATTSSTDPTFSSCYYAKGGNSVWYEYTPGSSGLFTFDTSGSNYDTVVGIWTGTVSSLTLVGCNDDINASADNLASKVSVSVEAGTKYYIEVIQWKETNGITASSLGKPEKLSASATGGGTLAVTSTFDTCYTLSTPLSPSTSATITRSPAPNCLSTKYKPGTNVTLTLTEKTGFLFLKWNTEETTKTITVNVDSNKTVQAYLSGAPALVTPAQTGMVDLPTLLLKWNASSPYVDHYQLQIGTTSKFSDIVFEDTGIPNSSSPVTYSSVTGLDPNKSYYWRVRAVSASGTLFSGWSSVRLFKTRLPIPTLISPSISTITLRPTFQWNRVVGNAGYTLQISTRTDCSSPSFTYSIATTSADPVIYTVSSSLKPNTNYYWCVTTKGTNPSLLSVPMNFLSPIPPGTPTLKTPANGSTYLSDSLVAVWNASSGAVSYTLQYDTNTNFTSFVEESSIPSTTWTSGSVLLPNKTYYWRVKAVNASSAESVWSSTFSFKTPMTAPVAASPDGTADMLRPVFSWSRPVDNTGLTGYTIQIAKNNIFTSGLISKTITGNPVSPTSTPSADLARSTTYYWRVKANGTRPSGWSNVLSFVTPNPPGVPTLLSPATGTFFATDYTPTMDWNDVSGSSITYHIQVSSSSNFSTTVINQTGVASSTYTPGSDLDPNFTYYWRVRSTNDGVGFSLWSAVRNYRTAMYAPVLTSPVDPGNPAMSLKPPFTWSRPVNNTGLTGYSFQLATNALFTTGVVNATVSGNSATPSLTITTLLTPGISYYWHVKANGTNPSQWSDTELFTSPTPPGVPVPTSPVGSVLLTDYTPTFNWNDVAGSGSSAVDHYDIQVSLSSTFSSFAVDDSTADVSSDYTPLSNLSSNKSYYWRVRSVNADGAYSIWSSTGLFRTAMLPPVVISPITTGNALRQVFVWNKVTGATSYTLKLSKNSDMSAPSTSYSVTAPTTSTVSYTISSNLDANTTYYWTVAANGTNSSLPSDPTAFLTPNPPPPPALTAPANGAQQYTYKPTLTWTNVPGADNYTLQIALNSSFTSGVQTFNSITEETYTFASNLAVFKTYYWHVRSVDTDDAYGAWSVTRSFKTPEAAPGALIPADGYTTHDSTPHFDWDPAGSSTSFTIQVCTVDTCETGTVYWSQTTTGTGATMSIAMINGTTYYWRVRGDTTAWTTSRAITYTP